MAAFCGGNERDCAGGHTRSEQKVNFMYSRGTQIGGFNSLPFCALGKKERGSNVIS